MSVCALMTLLQPLRGVRRTWLLRENIWVELVLGYFIIMTEISG